MLGKANSHEISKDPMKRKNPVDVTLQPEKNAVGIIGYLQEIEDVGAGGKPDT